MPELQRISEPEAAEADSPINEALAALSSLAEQTQRWLADLVRAQSTFRSLNSGRDMWQPSGAESQIVLPLSQARLLLHALLAESARRVDYVRPATGPTLNPCPARAPSSAEARVRVRELMVRPDLFPARDENVEVRATQAELPEVAILDATFAFIPSWPTITPVTVAVVRNELVAAQLTRFFEAAWGHAALPPRREPILKASDSEIKVRIVRMLADGVKDETAARRLGISLRTCRKHVAEILEELGSSSRFQAGFRAGLAGMVPEQWPR